MAFPLAIKETGLYPSRVWAEIDLTAIRHNISSLRRHISPAGLMAVVKANAYGLGAVPVARAALEAGATSLAVATVVEGQELRQAGIQAQILVLGFVPVDQAAQAVENDLTLTVNSPQLAEALSQEQQRRCGSGRELPVHLKLDTGLHRFGLDPQAVLQLACHIARLPGLRLQGLYTHFATGDEDDLSFVYEQKRRFDAGMRLLEQRGFAFEQVHLSNSASAICVPEARYGLVRAGLAIYGYYPSPSVETVARRAGLALQPALSLKSSVARLSLLEQGETVGYNRSYLACNDRRLALVPVGYADGYFRSLSNRGFALVKGRRALVAGRVSMDQISLDVTGIEGLTEGDEVVLIGRQGQEEITLDELAAWCGTISYEVMTGLGRRIKRVYL